MPDTSLRSLVDDLASPDPAVRDDGAYATLTRLVRDGDLPLDDRSWLGDAMVQRLRHERTEARSFAPLVLASLVAVGDLDEAWIPAVTRWYVDEQDLRGHDPELGWVHPVAHGADFFGACGAAGVGDPAALLDALARRMVEPTGFVWRDQEDDGSRVPWPWCSRVTTSTSRRPSGGSTTSPPLRVGLPGPRPTQASNTMRTLRSLHVALGEDVLRGDRTVTVAHADRVRAEVALLLAEVTPWFWRPRAS